MWKLTFNICTTESRDQTVYVDVLIIVYPNLFKGLHTRANMGAIRGRHDDTCVVLSRVSRPQLLATEIIIDM